MENIQSSGPQSYVGNQVVSVDALHAGDAISLKTCRSDYRFEVPVDAGRKGVLRGGRLGDQATEAVLLGSLSADRGILDPFELRTGSRGLFLLETGDVVKRLETSIIIAIAHIKAGVVENSARQLEADRLSRVEELHVLATDKVYETTNPFHILRHEHRVIEQVLGALYGICLRLEWGEQISNEALTSIVDFIRTFINEFHHGKEENCLFPALERGGILNEPLALMTAEHRLESDLTAELELSCEDYQAGDPGAATRFVEAARAYGHHVLTHMHREDSILLRLADELLEEEEKNALMREFKQFGRRFGKNEQYERLATKLELSWSV